MKTKTAKKPTVTGLVIEVLTGPGVDFVERDDLFERVRRLAPGINIGRQHLHAALFHLRKHRCVDVVIENDGRGWWYSTVEWDDRLRVLNEIKDGVTRPRRSRIRKIVPSDGTN